MRILLVNDEVNLLRTTTAILERAGHCVVAASCACEALQATQADVFDLLLLDVHRPKDNGLTLLRQVHIIAPRLPVILFTTYPSPDTAAAAIALGATGYLIRPLDPARLLDFIRVSDLSSR